MRWAPFAPLLGIALGCTASNRTEPSQGPLPLTDELSTVTWAKESVHPIEWPIPTDLGELLEYVTVEQSVDGGRTYAHIGTVALQERYFRWTLPADGEQARIRVTFFGAKDGRSTGALRHLDSPEVRLAPSQRRNYTWKRVANDAPFGPRDGAGGLVFGGKMWLIGGWNGNRFPLVSANDVWSSTDGATWTEVKPNTFVDPQKLDRANDWEGRHFAGYQVWNGAMWIVGGDVVQGYYQTDVWRSTDGAHWTRTDVHRKVPRLIEDTNPNSPTFGTLVELTDYRPAEVADFGMRSLHVTGVFRNRLYVMGGQRIEQFVNPIWPGAPAAAFNDVWVSDDGARFTMVPTASPMWSPRGLVGEAVEHDGRMWLIGGGTYDDPGTPWRDRTYSNEVWSTRDGARWEKTLEQPPFSPRVWHNVKVFDGRIFVINGYDGPEGGRGRAADNLRDVWYSTDGRNWYDAKTPAELTGRHAGTAWVHAGSLFVGSGNAFAVVPPGTSTARWIADVWRMSIAE